MVKQTIVNRYMVPIFIACVAYVTIACANDVIENEKPNPTPEYPASVVASFGLSTEEISSISVYGSKIITLNEVAVEPSGYTILETAGENAALILPEGQTLGKGEFRLRLRTSGFDSKLHFTFIRSKDDAVANLDLDPKSFEVRDSTLDLGIIDKNLDWNPTTNVTLDFIESGLFENPFILPEDFSKTYNNPTKTAELVTVDNLVFKCNVSNGFVKHDSYGFRVLVKDGDNIALPRIKGLTPALFRTTTVKENESYGYCPVNAGIEGCYTSIPEGEGKTFCWHFLKPEASGEYLLEFQNYTGNDFAEFRSAGWELLYTGTAEPCVTSVSTATVSDISDRSAVLNGSFRCYKNEIPASFSCGFEYRTAGGEWKNLDSTPSGFRFSTTLTGLEQGRSYVVRAWASDSGSKLYGKEYDFRTETSATDKTLKVLGIGNSWTRDSFRYICGIVKSAGVSSVIAHAYLGGSSLQDQFYGIDDLTYTYDHNGPQVVHSTYQYWLYDGTENPLKTPSDNEYDNGAKGTGVTLESILKDKAWDIIIFQPSQSFVSRMDLYLGRESSDPSQFSMARFVNKVKGLLPSDVAAKVKIGFLVPWSYPIGCTNHSSFVYTWNGGSIPEDQSGWDRCFDEAHAGIQKQAKTLASSIGCEYFVNVGKAIYFGRQNEVLLTSGYKLQREQDNTHLAEGVAKYLASLMFAYEIFGLRPEQITFCPSTYDFNQARTSEARTVAWAAWKGDEKVEVASVSTLKPQKTSGTGAVFRGSFYGKYPNSAKDFTCGFEYREDGGEWKVITVDNPFYEFTYPMSGLNPEKRYSIRAWAACGEDKKYGEEQILNFGSSQQPVVLKPTVDNFKNQGIGIPGPKDYPKTGADPGQEMFADRKFVYTHPDTGAEYDFYFYGKGPASYSGDKYFLYFAYSGNEFLFGNAGSYIKLPAVPGMRLESVTLSCSSTEKSWAIAETQEQINARKGIPGGEKHKFNNDSYTFVFESTLPNTSYYIFSCSGTAKIRLDSIVYSE